MHGAPAGLKGLEATGGGSGIVSHAGVVALLRALADKTGLTGGLS